MHLSTDEVRRIARLAHLRLTPEEEELFVPQLEQIIDYFDQLQQFDTEESGRDTVSSTLEADDEPRPSMDPGKFLDNAPATRGTFFLVPQVKVPGDG